MLLQYVAYSFPTEARPLSRPIPAQAFPRPSPTLHVLHPRFAQRLATGSPGPELSSPTALPSSRLRRPCRYFWKAPSAPSPNRRPVESIVVEHGRLPLDEAMVKRLEATIDDGVQRTCVFNGLPTQTFLTATIEPKRLFSPRCKQSPQANIAPGAAERWSLVCTAWRRPRNSKESDQLPFDVRPIRLEVRVCRVRCEMEVMS
jgi:hypothetical protein